MSASGRFLVRVVEDGVIGYLIAPDCSIDTTGFHRGAARMTRAHAEKLAAFAREGSSNEVSVVAFDAVDAEMRVQRAEEMRALEAMRARRELEVE